MFNSDMNPSTMAADSDEVEFELEEMLARHCLTISCAQRGSDDVVLDAVVNSMYWKKLLDRCVKLIIRWLMAKNKCAERASGILADLKKNYDRLLMPEHVREDIHSIQKFRVVTDDDDEIVLKSKTFSQILHVYIALIVLS